MKEHNEGSNTDCSILIIGDVHLGKNTSIGKPGSGLSLNSRISDRLELLSWSLDIAINNSVSDIFFVGDIFHDIKPDYRLVYEFFDFVKNVVSNNINVHIIFGNHDLKRIEGKYFSVLDLLNTLKSKHVFLYKEIVSFSIGNFGITCLPFRDKNCFEQDPQNASKILSSLIKEQSDILDSFNVSTKILLGHIPLEGAIYVGDESDNMNVEVICPDSSFYNYNYTIMGHVHKPQIKSNSPYICHIGSLDITDFGEIDQEKRIILISTKVKNLLKNIIVPIRQLRKIFISVPKLDDFAYSEYIIEQVGVISKNVPIIDSIIRLDVQFDDAQAIIDRDKVYSEIYKKHKPHYICDLVEHRSATVYAQEVTTDTDTLSDPRKMVKVFAESAFSNDEENDKQKFINKSIAIIDDIELSQKK